MDTPHSIACLDENKNFDVSLDWIYKGKRKNKVKQQQQSIKLNKQSVDNDGNGIHSTDKELKTKYTVLNKRNRSASVSNALLDSSILKTTNSSSNNNNNNNNVRRSSSSSSSNSDAKRKSLLTSLFGKKTSQSTSSTTSPAFTATNMSESPHSTAMSMSIYPPSNSTAISPPSTSTSQSSENDALDMDNIGTNVPLKVGSPDFNNASPSSNVLEDTLQCIDMGVSASKLNSLSKVPLKRVVFAVDKFETDPPQQLPSRNPKLGNVLIPYDMISDTPSISKGISNVKDSKLNDNSYIITKDSQEFKSALEAYNQNLKEAVKHQQEAHKAAEKIAKEVKTFNNKSSRRNSISSKFHYSNSKDDDINSGSNSTNLSRTNSNASDHKSKLDTSIINIDNPLHLHEHYFETDSTDNKTNNDKSSSISSNLTLDIIYTRCCHLREILPIPSTLRQLRGKTSPLHMLKFLNPRPTLIDILSFCDFIAIIPIHNVIFDNVTLNSEMLRIILSSLVNSDTLEKIGLRNVVISQNDWPFFCKFLLQNKSITRLDISQTKKKSDLSLKDHRECMDWDLLTHVIKLRKGKPLEELLLNGIKLSHIPLLQFQHLLNSFGENYRQSLSSNENKSPSTESSTESAGSDNVGIRLGLASTEITDDYLTVVLNWMSKYSVQGVDFSFNSLDAYLKLLAKKFARLSYDNLQYFSLNNTNVSNVTSLALLLKYLSRLPNLKFLDLSNIQDVFPGIIPYLYKYLPRFPNLKRIHIDYDNLNYRQIIMLCNILVKCNNLLHVSMLYEMDQLEVDKTTTSYNSSAKDDLNIGTTKGTYTHKFFTRNTVWAALYSLARDSPNLFTLDIPYEQVSDEIQSRIALCLMRNMQHAVNSDFKIDALSSQDQLLFDGTLLAETADDVLKKLNTNTLMDDNPQLAAAKKYMLKKYLEKLYNLLNDVQKTIDNVFEKRKIGELPSKEKENLLRLLLLEKNLKNIIEIVFSIPSIQNRFKSSFINSSSNNNRLGDEDQSILPSQSSRPLLKHLDSERLMAEVAAEEDAEQDPAFPHIVATEEGNRIVDMKTGKSLLYKTSSSTSIHSKLQEKEEGELHKWGFFVQQQRSMYPQDSSPLNIEKSMHTSDEDSYIPHLPTPNCDSGAITPLSPKFLPRIPSGEELRKAIIKAKGVATMDDLIQNVASNKHELENIYNAAYFLTGHTKNDGKDVEDDKSKDLNPPSTEKKM